MMNYMIYMQKVLDYIEDNLRTDIGVTELARIAGYSEYHFPRVFKQAVGMTPADYIRKRRISEIVRCMMTESRPISDIAFEYGFHSKENFIRAFKREHRILPTAFRAAGNSLKLYDRLTLDRPGGLCAVFDTPPATQFDFVSTIQRTWDYIQTWLPEHGFRRMGGYEWECYIESSRTFTERIYIPITQERNDPS